MVRLHQESEAGAGGRLAELLRVLAAPPAPPASGQGDGDGMAAILGLIDATVLPRQVWLAVDGHQALYLLIGNRRLLQVALADGGDDGDGAPDPADPEAAARGFAALLRDQLHAGGRIALRRARPAAGLMMPDLGCDADQLAAALEIAAPAPPPTAAAEGFEARVQALAVAWVRLRGNGRIMARSDGGEGAMLDKVLAHAHWPVRCEGPQCTLLPGPNGMDLSVSGGAGDRLICLSPASARARLFAAWAACHGAG